MHNQISSLCRVCRKNKIYIKKRELCITCYQRAWNSGQLKISFKNAKKLHRLVFASIHKPEFVKFKKSSQLKHEINLMEKYGIEIFNDLDQLETDFYLTLQMVGLKHGLTRERVRQIFKNIKGYPYTNSMQKKSKVRKEEIKALNCCNDPRHKVAEYKDSHLKYGAIHELMFLEKCELMGLNVEIPCSKTFDMIVNDFRVDVKSAKKAVIMSGGKIGHYHYGAKQREVIDFFACYHNMFKTFFIIPAHEVKSDSIFINEIGSKYHNAKNRWFKYMNAWHLLMTTETTK